MEVTAISGRTKRYLSAFPPNIKFPSLHLSHFLSFSYLLAQRSSELWDEKQFIFYDCNERSIQTSLTYLVN